jgi:4-carboxymuconolactone decarboxylase
MHRDLRCSPPRCSPRSGGCEPQLKGHVAANLHVGNDRGRLIEVLTQLIPFIGYSPTLNALGALDEAGPRLSPT